MAELTVDNFVSIIKSMSPSKRNKITKDDLLNLILQLPDSPSLPSVDSFEKLSHKVEGLVNQLFFTQSQVSDISAKIS